MTLSEKIQILVPYRVRTPCLLFDCIMRPLWISAAEKFNLAWLLREFHNKRSPSADSKIPCVAIPTEQNRFSAFAFNSPKWKRSNIKWFPLSALTCARGARHKSAYIWRAINFNPFSNRPHRRVPRYTINNNKSQRTAIAITVTHCSHPCSRRE